MAGCSSGSEAPDAAQTSVREIDPATATPLELRDDLRVLAKLPTQFGKRNVYFTGFADRATLFGSMSLPEPPSRSIPSAVKSRSYPFLYDLTSRKFTILDESARQFVPYVADSAASAASVVWVEGHGISTETSDFDIRSFDRTTHKATKIGRFRDNSNQATFANDLVVHDGIAYFSTHVFSRSKGQRPAIYSVPVDGSDKLDILVPDAGEIELEGDSLTFAQGNVHKALNLQTDAVTTIPPNSHAAEPGFCGSGKTSGAKYWCAGKPYIADDQTNIIDPLLTFEDARGNTTKFVTITGDDEQYPVPMDVEEYGDWVTVRVSGGDWPSPQYLIDLGSGAARVMPTDTMLTETLPGSNLALVSEVTHKGGKPQLLVELPRV